MFDIIKKEIQWGELQNLIKELDVSGYDTSNLKRIRDALKVYPIHENVLKKNNIASKIKIFDRFGNFRQLADIAEDATSGLSEEARKAWGLGEKSLARKEYEHVRRLFITMVIHSGT